MNVIKHVLTQMGRTTVLVSLALSGTIIRNAEVRVGT